MWQIQKCLWRKKKKVIPEPFELPPEGWGNMTPAVSHRELLNLILNRDILRGPEKTVLQLRMQGMSYQMIGNNYNASKEKIKAIEAKAIYKVKQYIKQQNMQDLAEDVGLNKKNK